MKKIKGLAVLTVILLCAALLLCGCNENGGGDESVILEEDIKEIFVRTGSLKSEYELDEKLDFSTIFLVVTSKTSSKQQVVQVTGSMVSGFDTTTSGKKTMTVTYKGKSVSWMYNVTASEKKITTSARMYIKRVVSGDYATLTLGITKGDLEMTVKALEFEFVFDTSKYTFDKENGEISPTRQNWLYSKYFLSSTSYSFNTVCYAGVEGEGITTDSDVLIVVLGYQGAGNGPITLRNVTVTDGDTEMILPDCVLE